MESINAIRISERLALKSAIYDLLSKLETGIAFITACKLSVENEIICLLLLGNLSRLSLAFTAIYRTNEASFGLSIKVLVIRIIDLSELNLRRE